MCDCGGASLEWYLSFLPRETISPSFPQRSKGQQQPPFRLQGVYGFAQLHSRSFFPLSLGVERKSSRILRVPSPLPYSHFKSLVGRRAIRATSQMDFCCKIKAQWENESRRPSRLGLKRLSLRSTIDQCFVLEKYITNPRNIKQPILLNKCQLFIGIMRSSLDVCASSIYDILKSRSITPS